MICFICCDWFKPESNIAPAQLLLCSYTMPPKKVAKEQAGSKKRKASEVDHVEVPEEDESSSKSITRGSLSAFVTGCKYHIDGFGKDAKNKYKAIAAMEAWHFCDLVEYVIFVLFFM